MSEAIENTWPWRTGTQVGRTIYACPPGSSYRNGEVLIGMMDSPEIAAEAVAQHNNAFGFKAIWSVGPVGSENDERRNDEKQPRDTTRSEKVRRGRREPTT